MLTVEAGHSLTQDNGDDVENCDAWRLRQSVYFSFAVTPGIWSYLFDKTLYFVVYIYAPIKIVTSLDSKGNTASIPSASIYCKNRRFLKHEYLENEDVTRSKRTHQSTDPRKIFQKAQVVVTSNVDLEVISLENWSHAGSVPYDTRLPAMSGISCNTITGNLCYCNA